MKVYFFLLASVSVILVSGQTIAAIDRLVAETDEILQEGEKVQKLLIERAGKRVAISRLEVAGQTVKVTASFYEDDFRLFKSFYLSDGELVFYREQKIIGDDIARLEEAKSDEMSADELKRAANAKFPSEEYYFRKGELFFSRTDGRPLAGEFLKEELDFFLSKFP